MADQPVSRGKSGSPVLGKAQRQRGGGRVTSGSTGEGRGSGLGAAGALQAKAQETPEHAEEERSPTAAKQDKEKRAMRPADEE